MNPPCEEMSPVYRHLQQSKNSYIYPESLRFSTTLIKHVSTPIHTPLLTKYYPDNQCSICSNKPQVLPRITCASSFSPVFSSPLIPALFALSDPFLSSYPLQSLTGVIITGVQLAKRLCGGPEQNCYIVSDSEFNLETNALIRFPISPLHHSQI